MSAPVFTPADLALHRDVLVELNVEYIGWVCEGIEERFGLGPVEVLGAPVAAYVPGALAKVCLRPPDGVFYLVSLDGAPAGMGGLRRLHGDVGEVKRVYVRPGFRGHRLGERIMARLLEDARALGLSRVVLDTAPFMTSAHGLYARMGFVDRGPYPGGEVPERLHASWRFMERTL
ncbi:MAG: GNAT family N-acetyltransferase [Anaeromyxobacteraceae bacterium]